MRFLPLPGRRIPRFLPFRLNPLGTDSTSRSPPRIATNLILPLHHKHPSLHGSTRMATTLLEPASQSTRLGCELPKRVRSAGEGKPRYAATSIRPVAFESNEMVRSVMVNPRVRDARLEVWPASTPRNAKCVERTKSRARTVVGKKIHSTLSADRRFLPSFPQPLRTLPSTPSCSCPSLSIACIDHSVLDQLVNGNMRINNRHWVPFSITALQVRARRSTSTAKSPVLSS